MEKEKLAKHEALVLAILGKHIGEEKAIDMGRLYSDVFNESYNNKINDTKPLRDVVKKLRGKGFPIGSTQKRNRGGYYLCRSGTELNEYCNRLLHLPAMRKLKMESQLKKISMMELLGQMTLNLEAAHDN